MLFNCKKMASNDADAEREERLKSALWYSIGQFIDEKSLEHELNATPQYIGALTELVYTQIANTARDLEVFSKHAGRKIISPDDVLLLGRRNEQLQAMLEKELEDIRAAEGRRPDGQPVAAARVKPAAAGAAAGKKRGRPAGTGKGKGKA
ncbi:Centromere S [Pyrenophora seminiperda CCB06]|uniref:Centromere S n=1 Tax=Pyrenophora seminiperda CCB06 TaxID=1302712 RepID=A0A3M7M9S9_9PLEO|nr:Centromere S [Pyrenophora seminiperda CCB06]